MAKDVFLYTGCSLVLDAGLAGGGWVAVGDGRIAYGNAPFEGIARVSDAEAAAGLAGVRFALDAFPAATRLLITTDGGELQFVPCGVLAEGLDPASDRTGIVGECRARGVEPFVRWWPGHNPGPKAADILLLAARVLALQGRRGIALSEVLDVGPGWRSRLAMSIGRHPFNQGIKASGLTRRQAAALVGVGEDAVAHHLASGRLGRANPVGISLSSALELRDHLESAGTVTWPPDDFGATHLDACSTEPVGRVFVAYHAHAGNHGVAVAAPSDGQASVWSRRVGSDPGGNAHRSAVVSTILALSERLDDFADGVVEVVTTDPWLGTLLDSGRHRDAAIARPLGTLIQSAATRGIVLRPRLVREETVRLSVDGEAMAFMQVALAAARVAAASHGHTLRASSVRTGPDALLPRVTADAHAIGDRLTEEAQARVVAELFSYAPGRADARRRFEELVRVTHAASPGHGFVRRPILPGPFRGGIALAGDAVHAASSPLAIDGVLATAWEGWWRDYTGLCADHPTLALREAILRLDPEPDMTLWPEARHLSVAAWIAGGGEPCPFRMPKATEEAARAGLAPLLEACGGWPFRWDRTPARQAA